MGFEVMDNGAVGLKFNQRKPWGTPILCSVEGCGKLATLITVEPMSLVTDHACPEHEAELRASNGPRDTDKVK